MDYKAEQREELEALDSIYFGDMQIIEDEPYSKFSIPIKSEECDVEADGLACNIIFKYTPKYPEEVPEIDIDEPENIDEEEQKSLKEYLFEQANENLGMVMIFTLVSAGQEWLNVKWDEIKKAKEEGRLKKLKEDEEAERKRFEGTRVTVETFMKWKTQFEHEMGIAQKREKEDREGRKLTGRELFMTDKSLNESDLKYLDDGTGNVKISESLFSDLALDDLDTDEDDSDYNPNLNSDSDDS